METQKACVSVFLILFQLFQNTGGLNNASLLHGCPARRGTGKTSQTRRYEGEKPAFCPRGALFRLRRDRCLFLSLFSPHNGQPLPEGVIKRNAQPEDRHGDAVPKFFFRFQIFFAFHTAIVPSVLRLIPAGTRHCPIWNLAYYMPILR